MSFQTGNLLRGKGIAHGSIKGLLIRPFRKGDEISLQKNINDRSIYRYTLRIPYPYTKEDARKWVAFARLQRLKEPLKEMHFAIIVDGEVAGGIGISHIEGHEGEIGYWLGHTFRNRGIMTWAAKCITAFSFSELGLKRLVAYIFCGNKASARVLEKTGFRLEGRLRKLCLKDGRYFDSFLYAKIQK